VIHCKDCKHWDTDPANQGETVVAGYCKRIVPRPKVLRGDGSDLYEYPGDVTDEEARELGAYVECDVPSFEASLRTVAEFGCVLGETK